jgi:hypothetical protein
VVRQRTTKSRLARALMAIKAWCRTNRHLPIPAQRDRLAAKLVGHYAYYGITENFTSLQQYFRQVPKIWRKWLERRSRKNELPWATPGVRLIAYSQVGGSVTVSPNQLSYALGDTVTLKATAFPPYVFVGWDGDLQGSTNPAQLHMTGSKKVRAKMRKP